MDIADQDPAGIAAQLQQVTHHEAELRRTPLTWLLLKIGPTRAFAQTYRRVGPVIDPWILRHFQGRIVSRIYGLPVLLLTTVGRRSGETRTSPLVYIRDGSDIAVVGTNFGQHHHPGWTANLMAQPEASIEIGSEQLAIVAELVGQATWTRLWVRFLEVYPGYQSYLSRSGGRKPRMFLLHPSPPGAAPAATI